jgi:GT2 family glycosyltransferase
MKISVVICSRAGIPNELAKSLKQQVLQPDEVISVVGDSLTAQRNEGIRRASGDIVIFFDDDLILDCRYIGKIVEVFFLYPDAMAATGNVVARAFKSNILHTIFAHVFILSRRGKGRFLSSGFPETYDKHITSTIQAEVLHGCNMAIKKEVFEDVSFNEDLEGGMYGEDDWFSYDVSRKYPIYYTPFALCYDNRDYPTGTQSWATRCRIVNLVKRWQERDCSLLESIAFWWSMVGFITLKIIESIIMRDVSILKGIANACLCRIFKSK